MLNLKDIKNLKKEWVEDQSQDRNEQIRRKVIFIILNAFAISDDIKGNIAIKGGMLLAMKYGNVRYTKDIDFSDPEKNNNFEIEPFIAKLKQNIEKSCENMSEYGLRCAVQGHKKQPNKNNVSYPTYQIKIGYAEKNKRSAIRALKNGKAANIMKIDYSLNEPIFSNDELDLGNGQKLFAYSIPEIIAEKFRAIYQQKTRYDGKNIRSQDLYDIHFFLENNSFSEADKKNVFTIFTEKCLNRGIKDLRPSMLDDAIIKDNLKKKYASLAHSIPGELPSFEKAYKEVITFFKLLPW